MPTVTVTNKSFESLARAAARGSGYSRLPLFSFPADCETMPEEDIYRIAEDRLEEFVNILAGTGAPS